MAQNIYTYKVEILNLKKKRNILFRVSDEVKDTIYDYSLCKIS